MILRNFIVISIDSDPDLWTGTTLLPAATLIQYRYVILRHAPPSPPSLTSKEEGEEGEEGGEGGGACLLRYWESSDHPREVQVEGGVATGLVELEMDRFGEDEHKCKWFGKYCVVE